MAAHPPPHPSALHLPDAAPALFAPRYMARQGTAGALSRGLLTSSTHLGVTGTLERLRREAEEIRLLMFLLSLLRGHSEPRNVTLVAETVPSTANASMVRDQAGSPSISCSSLRTQTCPASTRQQTSLLRPAKTSPHEQSASVDTAFSTTPPPGDTAAELDSKVLDSRREEERNPKARPQKPPKSMVDPRQYKTQICKNWKTSGSCGYNRACSFAHGQRDLRNPDQNCALLLAVESEGVDVGSREKKALLALKKIQRGNDKKSKKLNAQQTSEPTD
eukprot:NODE_1970_length_1340_cov_8.573974_g1787_i0.p1 GENE.NODE_1970_length_1340_cov_8.573974_g1787_i0~~NODE_1970_length_1340_cov_8.573974_g1787_i0.p1  ORF type:complete len:296 (-),score=35.65 NODE_1970_length_1340_cov_8.573974_g1787_i0:453-1280(-)